jgi:tripartite-type tricarboxylate transporter receptor subunit TctC
VRIIHGFAPGGGADIIARLIGQWLSERLGQPFAAESWPGNVTNLATEAVIRASADGYTLLLATSPNAPTRRSTQTSISISSVTSRRSRVLAA